MRLGKILYVSLYIFHLLDRIVYTRVNGHKFYNITVFFYTLP